MTAAMLQGDETVDVVIVGSGAAGLCASLVLADAGKSVLVIEKTDKVGGSTAMSGGALWIPNHPLQAVAGVPDSYEMARTYLDAVLVDADEGRGATRARTDMFLRGGPAMVRFLLGQGVRLVRCDGWSDYQCDLPGGLVQGRTLAAPVYDARRLGDWNGRLRRGPFQMPIQGYEGRDLLLHRRTLAGAGMAMRYAWRRARMRLGGADLVGLGAALIGRLLEVALKRGVRIETEAPVSSLIAEKGRVAGVVVARPGRDVRIRARYGVIVASGGFAHDTARRRGHDPRLPERDFSHANPGDTGELLDMMTAIGAATDNLDQAVWVSTSAPPGRGLSLDANPTIAKPHVIVVGADGRRFGNESGAYMRFGQHQLAAGAVPAWAIIESRHRQRYFWAGSPPGKTPQAWFDGGYMKRSDTIEGLAAQIGVDPQGLRDTVDRFNRFARAGKDEDFGRGGRDYDLFYGDPTHKPNATLGAIERPPYHAVALYPGDIGTFGGVVTDAEARVVTEDGTPIDGLYAAGNCTAAVTGKHYPGAGSGIGPALAFGYVAARHISASSTP